MILQLALPTSAWWCALQCDYDNMAAAFGIWSVINLAYYLFSFKGFKDALSFPERDREFNVVIIGSGMSGMLMAIGLKSRGFRNFKILEKGDGFGGTWELNRYPGVGCDIGSHLYSFSFAPNPWWTKKFAEGEEIKTYLRRVADRHNLDQFTEFRTTVKEIEWNEEEGLWDIRIEGWDDVMKANVVIGATGALHVPMRPYFKNVEKFEGQIVHAAEWPEDLALDGKVVATIGSGATAVQLIPAVANQAKQVIAFQRSAAWVPPKFEYGYPLAARLIFWLCPFLMKGVRLWSFMFGEMVFRLAFYKDTKPQKYFSKFLTWNTKRSIQDPNLARRMIPTHPLGCKRVTPSDKYLKTFNRKNVRLVTDSIIGFDTDAIIVKTNDGFEKHPVDVVILCTGYSIDSVKKPFEKIGLNGIKLSDEWATNPQAFYGVTYPDFPNFYMTMGPNSGCASNSFVYVFETQVEYILKCLKALSISMGEGGGSSMKLRKEAFERFKEEVRLNMRGKAFAEENCNSWFFTGGENWALWPGSCRSYRKSLLSRTKADYVFV